MFKMTDSFIYEEPTLLENHLKVIIRQNGKRTTLNKHIVNFMNH